MSTQGFKVGDRVTRPVDVFKDDSRIRHGEVVERYSRSFSYAGVHGRDEELYAVRWDDTKQIERGYFRHGLHPEPLVIA